jgi:tetratricopeptide (TPR) repeat protein
VIEKRVRRFASFCVLTGLVPFSHSVLGQAALPPCVVVQPVANTTLSDAPQFYDEPQFTVAGVKDPSETGGHGSDTVRRTTEALTKETVGLGGGAAKTTDQERGAARDATSHHALADLEEKQGDSLAAVREYQHAAELSPSEINLFDWGAELLLHRAYEPASEVFAKGRRLFPGSVRMAMGVGVAAYALGSYDLAAQRLCEASDVDPSDERPYQFLGKLQAVGSGLVPGVVERLERFERLQPENATATYYHALALWKRRDGHPEAAAQVERLLRKAVGRDPRLAVGYLQLGVLYAERKDWPKAIGALQSSVNVDPDLEEGYFRLANAYRMAGEPGKAKVELERYQRIAKKNNGQAARDRHEIAQFVYSSRSGEPEGTKK